MAELLTYVTPLSDLVDELQALFDNSAVQVLSGSAYTNTAE